VSAIPLIFTSGWASGINAYAVVLVLGLLGRFDHMSAVPPTLERSDVLAVMAVLFIGQFVIGKIPYLDSAWDVVHTAIRPVMGGAIGVMMTNRAHSLTQAVGGAALSHFTGGASMTQVIGGATIGGGSALATHLIKTGVRMGINASPEPVSNIIASIVEDVTVAGMVAFALLHPVAAAVIAAILLVLGLILVIMLAKRIRRAWRRRHERRLQRQAGGSSYLRPAG
jgi:hypothetical protein